MKLQINKSEIQVAALGMIAGMRAMSAPAITSTLLTSKHHKAFRNSPLDFMQSKTTSGILSVMALGEFVGDKMPSAPNRTALPGLIGRGISGTLAGASLYKSKRKKWYKGALIGGLTALAATFGCFYLRKYIAENTNLPDPIIGALEDILVLGAGLALVETA